MTMCSSGDVKIALLKMHSKHTSSHIWQVCPLHWLLLLHAAHTFLEANRPSATQEIPRILWNPKVHYRIYNSPPPVPILSKIDPVIASHPTSLRFILVLSSHLHLGLPSCLLPSGCPTKTLYASVLSPHKCYMPCPSVS